MSGKFVLGIDLGTYNSAAAFLSGEGEVIPLSATPDRQVFGSSQERIKPFPSVAIYTPEGYVRAVGYEAKILSEKEPQYAVWGVKRLLGKTYKEALEHGELDRMLLSVEPDGRNGRCMFELGVQEIRPEQVCAELLKHIRHEAERLFDVKISDVVLSVPAYFDAIAIGATVEAAKLAGFELVETIPEPVAAALAYDLEVTPRPINFIVFDIGAGTLDVTAAEVWRTKPGPTEIECRCRKNTGDTHLGGLDMDDRLLQYAQRKLGIQSIDEEEQLALRRAMEAAKIRLSSETKTEIEIETGDETRMFDFTRMELEEALRGEPRDLLEACTEQVHEALKGAQWRPEQVERILLVGGPTAMPCIRASLEEVFRRNPQVLSQIRQNRSDVDPMLAVSIGAAKSRSTKITKIHPYGYGYVNVRLEPESEQHLYRVYREPAVLVKRDSVFPSDLQFVVPDNPFHRGDKIFSLEIIQQIPESERNVSSSNEYRFLGEFQLAFTRSPYLMQVTMRLNEHGELETTIRNILGTESATYLGVGSLQRHPIELPATKLMSHFGGGHWIFLRENAEAIKQWGLGFIRYLHAKSAGAAHSDTHLEDTLDDLKAVLTRWGSYIEDETNRVFTLGKVLLLRAQEVKIIEESERYRWEEELNTMREKCYRYEEL